MVRQLRYWGEFNSVDGALWRVELHQKSDGVDWIAQQIYFPAQPLIIEWATSTKLDVVESSSATLVVESDTDRRFVDLYQVQFGGVILNLYCDGRLYWSGTLDTELYEEPYSYNDNYDVTLTFSDFAPLERLKWQLAGCMSTIDIITECLRLSHIEYRNIVKRISTHIYKMTPTFPLTLNETYHLCENFYDEQGEAMSIKDVLTEVLKPFALKIKQRLGIVYIYDINAIAIDTPKPIIWDSTDATLSVDQTYNNVTLTFSPYADTTIIDGSQDPDIVAKDSESVLIHTDNNSAGGQFISPEGFRFRVSTQGSGNLTIGSTASYYCIEPEYSGSKEAGVAMTAQTYDHSVGRYVNLFGLSPAFNCLTQFGEVCESQMVMMTTQSKFINSDAKFANYKLKIILELLFDVRYNPFEQKQVHNEEGDWQDMQDWCNVGYVPIKIYIRDDMGRVLYHYNNSATLSRNDYKDRGRWVAGDTKWGDCYLAYYDIANRRYSTGFGGWKKNRPIIGCYQNDLPSVFEHIGEGQMIPMPPVSGWLVMEVGSGIYQVDYMQEVKNIYPVVRWVLYKGPQIKVVKSNGLDFSPEDIEIKAWINKEAKEELTIETVVGTMPTPIPSSRALVLNVDRMPITKFRRAGTGDTLERLLVSTAYSHYATKHDILSGTTERMASFDVYSDDNTPGVFIVSGEVQNIADNTSEATFVQIHQDDYTGIDIDG